MLPSFNNLQMKVETQLIHILFLFENMHRCEKHAFMKIHRYVPYVLQNDTT